MNIRNWPIGQIMQLPDCCFGRRFLISCFAFVAEQGLAWDISEVAFPERAVIWSMTYYSVVRGAIALQTRLALGDQLPTTAAMMTALDPLFMGLGAQGADPRVISMPYYGVVICTNMRHLVEARGRRLVLEVNSTVSGVDDTQVILSVSSIPTEVPDWLNSGHLRSP